MTPAFSVIVPTHDRPRWLREAVESVLAQDTGDFECLVVDDGGSQPLDLPDDRRIRVLRHDENAGLVASLHTGLDAARGDYVTFLDDDDRYAPDRLSMTLPHLERAPLILCWSQRLGAPPPAAGRAGARILEGNVYDSILDDRAPPKGAAVIARDLVPRFDARYETLEDLEWWLRVARDLDVTTARRVGYLVRVHAGSRARTGRVNRVRYGRMLLDEQHEYFCTHRRAAAMRWFSMGLVARELGDYRVARRAFTRSLLTAPVPERVGHLALVLRPSTFSIDDAPAPSPERCATRAPLVSVVLPVHDGGATIGAAVESVLAQGMADLELVVVDDASTDATAGVLAAVDDPRVHVVRFDERRGLVASLNAGVATASAALIARMDADDLAHPDRLALQHAVLAKSPEVGLVACAYERVDAGGRPPEYVGVPRDHGSAAFWLTFRCCIGHPTVMFRRDLFTRAGGYRAEEYPAEDYGLWLRMIDLAQVATIPTPELTMRRHGDSISARMRDEQVQRTLELAAGAIARTAGEHPSERVVAALAGVGPRLGCDDFDDAFRTVRRVYEAVRRASYARGAPAAALPDELPRALLLCGVRDADGGVCRDRVAHVVARHPMLSARVALALARRRAMSRG
ncbi:MAG TPA: glycosyltransferase [Acidimicrobiia bacterium]|nr:glycosyltransferase [Acidimicrobiia bacterium]